MKVDYLFSRNRKIGSRVIAWASSYERLGFDKTPSHCAVLLNDTWVIESTLFTGVRVVPYNRWLAINEELYKIPCERRHRSSVQVLELATSVWQKKYDWLGICYFALSYSALIFLRKPLPKKNPWQSPDKYFCCEYLGLLSGVNYEMTSPAKLCHDMVKHCEEQDEC